MTKLITDVRAVSERVCSDVEGWLDVSAAIFTAELLNFQHVSNISGGILEFGVHKGCFLSLLRGGCDLTEKVVGVDAFFERLGVPLSLEWREHAKNVIKDNVSSIWGDADNVELVAGLTESISAQELLKFSPGGFRFISIDAGHDAENVFGDLCLAEKVLSEDGVMALDDIFNPLTPGVPEGFFRWSLGAAGNQRFRVISYCGNKAYVTSIAAHEKYIKFARDLLKNIKYGEVFSAGIELSKRNDENGFNAMLIGGDYLCLTGR
jgi:hypothetical protein